MKKKSSSDIASVILDNSFGSLSDSSGYVSVGGL